jgi:hypothetical protein
MKAIGKIAFVLFHISLVAWGCLAIYFSYLPVPLRYGGAGLFAVVSIAVLLLARPKLKGAVIFWAMFAVVLLGWFSMKPSNHRDWQADNAVLPYAEVNGDVITIHNIRNFDYRTETDYATGYYDKSFNLSSLNSFDVFLCDWGLNAIVHTMVSFGFDDGSFVCISIETRKEKGEAYSTLKGFFRQYEQFYVVADERDLIRLRTNYRQGETVYLYRIQNVSMAVVGQVFMDYISYINRLTESPEWYNALTGNCTTEIRGHTRPNPDRIKWDWRILANGYIDELMYEKKMVDTSIPFTALKKQSIINQNAMAADQDPDFSKKIRQNLPGMDPVKQP